MNAGLGLGLPSTFTTAQTSGRSVSSKTVVPQDPHHGDYLFPLPAFKGRTVSAETYRVRDLQSYWSPDTAADEEAFQTEADFESPAQALAEEDGILSPLQLAAHACLHLLSPKGDALGRAAASRGLSAEDALASALEFAWLVPMVDTKAVQEQLEQLETLKEPLPVTVAPAMRSMPSIASIASSLDFGSSTPSSEVSSPSECDAADMARSHSIFSSFSTSSLSTAATSSASIMDRKRPISGHRSASSQIIKLQGPRRRKIAAAGPKQQTLHKRASVRSQCASVELYTPTSEDLEVMMQPMERLPSPTTSASASLASNSPSRRPGHLARSDTRATLLEIWSVAEEAERSRRASVSRSGDSTTVGSSRRVSKWVQKQVRKSTSTASLLRRLDEDAKKPYVEPDPAAWAEGKEQAFEQMKEENGIVRTDSIQQRLSEHSRSGDDALWAFLG